MVPLLMAALRQLLPQIAIIGVLWLCATKTFLAQASFPWIFFYAPLCRTLLNIELDKLENTFLPPFCHAFDLHKPVTERQDVRSGSKTWRDLAVNLLLPRDATLFPELVLWKSYQRFYAPLIFVKGAPHAKFVCKKQKNDDKAAQLTVSWCDFAFVFLELMACAVHGENGFYTHRRADVYCVWLCAQELFNFLRYALFRWYGTFLAVQMCKPVASPSLLAVHTAVLVPLKEE